MQSRVYFLGIGGTLMGSLAILAKQAGYSVSGSDGKIYPPMSTMLAEAGIEVHEGFEPEQLQPPPDAVVIGNANLPRGAESLEYVLEQKLNYESGAEWLGRHILRSRSVIAVAGTHGKTSTASMLAWILESNGRSPGYLIGGVPLNLNVPAQLGSGMHFVVEADEYDTSYFDRRAKFMHYRPQTLLINNIEYDHADIYADLAAIQYQFHHVIRSVPRNGRIVVPWDAKNVQDVLNMGCWSNLSYTAVDPTVGEIEIAISSGVDFWYAKTRSPDGSIFKVFHNNQDCGELEWELYGQHNVANALQTIVAALEAGVAPKESLSALATFKGIKRRMEVVATKGSLTVYDDFAHHPTAVATTLQGLRDRVGSDKILAVIEPRTHTMQMGTHRDELLSCCGAADRVIWFNGPNVTMDIETVAKNNVVPSSVVDDIDKLCDEICHPPDSTTHVVLMSNGGFGGIYEKVRARLS